MAPGWQYHARFTIEGARGRLVAENSLLPHLGHSIQESIDGVFHQYTIGGATTFDYQLAAVVKALRDGTPLPTEGADPIGNMTTIDSIYAKAGMRR
jgi:predicted dehydrogenase